MWRAPRTRPLDKSAAGRVRVGLQYQPTLASVSGAPGHPTTSQRATSARFALRILLPQMLTPGRDIP